MVEIVLGLLHFKRGDTDLTVSIERLVAEVILQLRVLSRQQIAVALGLRRDCRGFLLNQRAIRLDALKDVVVHRSKFSQRRLELGYLGRHLLLYVAFLRAVGTDALHRAFGQRILGRLLLDLKVDLLGVHVQRLAGSVHLLGIGHDLCGELLDDQLVLLQDQVVRGDLRLVEIHLLDVGIQRCCIQIQQLLINLNLQARGLKVGLVYLQLEHFSGKQPAIHLKVGKVRGHFCVVDVHIYLGDLHRESAGEHLRFKQSLLGSRVLLHQQLFVLDGIAESGPRVLHSQLGLLQRNISGTLRQGVECLALKVGLGISKLSICQLEATGRVF